MIKSSGQSGHSAQVKMRLLLNGSTIPVAQMGPDFLILQSATEHPPSDATLELCVDRMSAAGKCGCPTAFPMHHEP
jgi:hypothetical protein